MRILFRLCLLLVAFAILNPNITLAKRILYIPMDNRPVCLDYTLDTLKSAGWDIVTPPRSLIASRDNMGNPDALMDWLEKEAKSADAAVVSTDALIYGGLVSSRTHSFDEATLARRLDRLVRLKNKQLDLRLYAFSTIMRTPRASSGGVEPAYYETWGPSIFRWSELEDKSEIIGLDVVETQEKEALLAKIPQDILQDWLSRRDKNFNINKELVYSMEHDSFDYFVMGKDDTAPYSQSHKESRLLENEIENRGIGNYLLENYLMFVGADQLGLVLLTKAINDQNLEVPFIFVEYARGTGPRTVPTYEDTAVGNTVKSHIYAAGGFPAKSKDRADLILFVNTPFDGVTKEASSPDNTYLASKYTKNFVGRVKKDLNSPNQIPVSVADIEFGNGASNALVSSLLKERIGYRLESYAGWNTASNTIGYALSQGILGKKMSKEDKNRLMTIRYLDDWAYQANVRGQLYNDIIWPKNLSGVRLGSNEQMLEKAAYVDINQVVGRYIPAVYLKSFSVDFPWDRLFEIEIVIPK